MMIFSVDFECFRVPVVRLLLSWWGVGRQSILCTPPPTIYAYECNHIRSHNYEQTYTHYGYNNKSSVLVCAALRYVFRVVCFPIARASLRRVFPEALLVVFFFFFCKQNVNNMAACIMWKEFNDVQLVFEFVYNITIRQKKKKTNNSRARKRDRTKSILII